MVAASVLAACGDDGDPPALAPPALAPPAPDAQAQAQAQAQAVDTPPPHRDAVDTAQAFLAQAAALEHDGYWEAALVERAAVLDGGLGAALPREALLDAQLAQARLLLRLERYGDAAALVETVQRDAATPTALRSLDLLEARATTGLGEIAVAVAAYGRYLQGGGAAGAAVRLLRADLLARTGAATAAQADLDAVLADLNATPVERAAARAQLGARLEAQEQYPQAAAHYERLLVEAPSDSHRALALHRLGAVAWLTGDVEAAETAWLRLLREYPWHWRAAEAHAGLDERAVPIDPITRGVFLYRQFRHDDAAATLDAFLAQEPPPQEWAVARYYRAAIDEDRGAGGEAVSGYLAAAAVDPTGTFAYDALWWAARLLEEEGQLSFASLIYDRLAEQRPTSHFAPRARFLATLDRFLLGDHIAAEAAFTALSTESATADAQRAWLWSGKTLERLGQPAAEAYQRAVALDPLSLYGLRAQALLAGDPAAPRVTAQSFASRPDPAPVDPAVTVAWLKSTVGPEPAARWATLDASLDLRAARELAGAGMRAEADARFAAVIDANRHDPWLLYRLGRDLDRLALTHLRLEAAAVLLDNLAPADRPAAPLEILRWAYPRGWPTLAQREAAERGLDDLLLYALIRQESRFNPDAGSPAGALGLTQVIAPTGADIAIALGEIAFDPASLFRPQRAIRYGAFYLAGQLDLFDGATALALAAYNAGPGTAARWSGGDATIDADLFYELVTFAETRLYIQLVLENYAWYQFVYGGGGAPTLLTSGDTTVSAPPPSPLN